MTLEELIDILDVPRADRDIRNDVGRLCPQLSIDDAYRVQFGVKQRRVARGDRIVGRKASFTSRSVTRQFPDFPAPLVGTVLASCVREDGATVDLNADAGMTFIENEVGVLLKRDLEGPGVTGLQALAAIEAFFPAIEVAPLAPGILEHKWTNQHIVAKEKADGGYLVCGHRLTSPRGIDIRTEGVVVAVNDEVTHSATAVEAMGSPVNVLAAVANRLSRYGEKLRAGEFVITGSLSGPVKAVPGDRCVRVEFTRLGSVEVHFEAA